MSKNNPSPFSFGCESRNYFTGTDNFATDNGTEASGSHFNVSR